MSSGSTEVLDPRQLDVALVINPAKIAVRNLSFFYGDKQVLSEASIDIPDKSVTALIRLQEAENPLFCAALIV
jgi:hypothetical protein